MTVRGVSVQGVSIKGGSLSRGDLCQNRPLYGNERAVRILLECILVLTLKLGSLRIHLEATSLLRSLLIILLGRTYY